jgi:hypothetical protein
LVARVLHAIEIGVKLRALSLRLVLRRCQELSKGLEARPVGSDGGSTYPMIAQRRQALLDAPAGVDIPSDEPHDEEEDDGAEDGPFDDHGGGGKPPGIVVFDEDLLAVPIIGVGVGVGLLSGKEYRTHGEDE